MKTLRRKMFWLLFLFLSLLLTLAVGFVLVRDYNAAYTRVSDGLLQTSSLYTRFSHGMLAPSQEDLDGLEGFDDFEDFEEFQEGLEDSQDSEDHDDLDDLNELPEKAFAKKKEAALPTYVCLFNKSGQIHEIIYSNEEPTTSELNAIYDKAMNILSFGKGKGLNIGNLFSTNYAWYFGPADSLTISNIESVQSGLIQSLLIWLILFVLLLGGIVWLARKLVAWMIAPIEETFDKQKQFIADASHELKTPLAVIYSNTQAFEKDHDEKWIRNIQSETDRMSTLVNDLLQLARLEQVQAVQTRVDLSHLVEKEALSLEAVFFEKGAELEEQIEPECYIEANEDQIRQVILILLDNALHHCAKKVRITVQARGNEIICSVENDGKGISPQDQKHIFERFYRSEKSRNRNDNRYGLGLAIASTIIEQHGAQISVHSIPNETTFTLTFRKAPAPKAQS